MFFKKQYCSNSLEVFFIKIIQNTACKSFTFLTFQFILALYSSIIKEYNFLYHFIFPIKEKTEIIYT